MTMKEFRTRVNCQDAEMAELVNDGWQIQYMQFMENGKLHVVFVREVAAPAPAAAPVVTVEPVPAPVKVPSKPLPAGFTIVGLDDPPRSVPTSFNKFKRGDTKKVHVPDGVMGEALARGQEVYESVIAQGAEAMKRAGESFRPNLRTEMKQ